MTLLHSKLARRRRETRSGVQWRVGLPEVQSRQSETADDGAVVALLQRHLVTLGEQTSWAAEQRDI